MTENNKATNTEEQLERLKAFQEQLNKTQTSFEFLYGSRWVRRFKRDNFKPESIEKLLVNVLLLKDIILDEGGLLDLSREKSVDIEKSLNYASTKQILKEVEKRKETGHIWYEENKEFERGKNINIVEGNKYLRSLDYDVEIQDNAKDETYTCFSCDEAKTTVGRSLCDKCLEEENEIVKLEKGMPTKMERIECKECHKVMPVLKYRRKMIDPKTQICWSCEGGKEEEEENN